MAAVVSQVPASCYFVRLEQKLSEAHEIEESDVLGYTNTHGRETWEAGTAAAGLQSPHEWEKALSGEAKPLLPEHSKQKPRFQRIIWFERTQRRE